ncbi:MAG: ornithine--oxo-acid transaminase [Candidatus Berkiellales bacterium]
MTNKTQEWIQQEKQYCAHNYEPLPVVLTKGEGVWVWDIEGKRYLDMLTAYSAVSFGHCHPRLVEVLSSQSQQLCLTSRAFYTDRLLPYAEKLCALTGMHSVLPMNSGAEAVETAIKAARRWGYEIKKIPQDKAEIIVAKNNFHGRTITIISFSSEPEYKRDFGPLTPGFVEIPFGESDALLQAITPNTCAFLIEPIQGESGIHVPPKGWLKKCHQICQENNVLLIVDEVQSGLGRTGKLFAFQHEGIQPDGLILGKGLGGGILPTSAFLGRKDLMNVFTPGSHGSTFGGNPLATRMAFEVLTLLEQEKLVENSAVLGEKLLQGLRDIKSPLIKEVRGKGLWAGVEIDVKFATARQICETMIKHGVLSKDTHQTVIRFAPPLIIKEEELKWAIEQFAKALGEFA